MVQDTPELDHSHALMGLRSARPSFSRVPDITGQVARYLKITAHPGWPGTRAIRLHPEKGRPRRCRRLKAAPGRGTREKEKPPILGMIQRGGQVIFCLLANVQQKTIKPITEAFVTKGPPLYTDERDMYDRLPAWGYQHRTVCHSRGEYARDEGGDGFHEIHVNTIEGFWSLLRSRLRPHRGVSQEKSRSILGSSSLFTMPAKVASNYSPRSSAPWSPNHHPKCGKRKIAC